MSDLNQQAAPTTHHHPHNRHDRRAAKPGHRPRLMSRLKATQYLHDAGFRHYGPNTLKTQALRGPRPTDRSGQSEPRWSNAGHDPKP